MACFQSDDGKDVHPVVDRYTLGRNYRIFDALLSSCRGRMEARMTNLRVYCINVDRGMWEIFTLAVMEHFADANV